MWGVYSSAVLARKKEEPVRYPECLALQAHRSHLQLLLAERQCLASHTSQNTSLVYIFVGKLYKTGRIRKGFVTSGDEATCSS